MITLDVSFVLIKVYTIILVSIFIYGFRQKKLETTELIISATMIFSVVGSQITTQDADFYTFYLSFAATCLAIVSASIFLHVIWQEVHSKATYFIYGLFLVKFLSHMLLHRVRTQVYETDEPIMWLISGHSALVITCDVLMVTVLFLRVSKWKLHFMRLA